MWATKGLAILFTGRQPPVLFEVAIVLFPVGLIGLRSALRGRGGRRAEVGGTLTYVALVLAAATAVAVALSSPSAVVGAGIAGTVLCIVWGLIFLGAAARGVEELSALLRWLPLALGVATVPLATVVAGVLEAIHERLLEVPIVVVGLGWAAVGMAIATEPTGAASDSR
jgi:hypothetical protein